MSKIHSFRAAILISSAVLFASLPAVVTKAQDAAIVQSSGDVFPDDTAANTIRWELRTASDQAVVWEYTFPTVNSQQPWSTSKQAFANTAASLNIDWTAWSAAVTNPAYSRWLVTRNGVTIERPWPGLSVGVTPGFVLDELDLTITKNTTNGHGNLGVGTGALDRASVPEPSASLLFVIAFLRLVTSRYHQGG